MGEAMRSVVSRFQGKVPFLLLFVIVALAACSKYRDEPRITLRPGESATVDITLELVDSSDELWGCYASLYRWQDAFEVSVLGAGLWDISSCRATADVYATLDALPGEYEIVLLFDYDYYDDFWDGHRSDTDEGSIFVTIVDDHPSPPPPKPDAGVTDTGPAVDVPGPSTDPGPPPPPPADYSFPLAQEAFAQWDLPAVGDVLGTWKLVGLARVAPGLTDYPRRDPIGIRDIAGGLARVRGFDLDDGALATSVTEYSSVAEKYSTATHVVAVDIGSADTVPEPMALGTSGPFLRCRLRTRPSAAPELLCKLSAGPREMAYECFVPAGTTDVTGCSLP